MTHLTNKVLKVMRLMTSHDINIDDNLFKAFKKLASYKD
jgi:hypothetical protein